MKTKEIFIMDEKDKRLSRILEKYLGSYTVAKILLYMLNNKTAFSKDVEQSLDVRQPEASIAFKKLRELTIVSHKTISTVHKGRPTHKYFLNKSLDDIKKSMEKEALSQIEEIQKDLKEMNKLFEQIS